MRCERGETYVTLKNTCKGFALLWGRSTKVYGSSGIARPIKILSTRVAVNSTIFSIPFHDKATYRGR